MFVDLGGVDGLLHITDVSWGRVNHPSEYFNVGDEIEVVVLKFDPAAERVSLGYKQKSQDPWTDVVQRYPLGSKVHGRVVSLTDYGAFIELEEGVEGLIHVSEMSWTKKVRNPSKLLAMGTEVDAVVTDVNVQNRRISLSLKALEQNPWDTIAERYPIGAVVTGKVRNLTDFGAFVEVEDGIDGLIHISDMSWNRRLKHPNEVLKKGDAVQARVISVDGENQRLSLSIKEFLPNEWDNFAKSHNVGDELIGTIAKITDFGLFIRVAEGVEGLAHVSEISRDPKAKLDKTFHVGEAVRTRIIKIDWTDKKIGLSTRDVEPLTEDEIAQHEQSAPAAEEHPADEAESEAKPLLPRRPRRKADRMPELDPVPAPGEAIAEPAAVPTPRKSRAGVFFLGAFSGCLVVFLGMAFLGVMIAMIGEQRHHHARRRLRRQGGHHPDRRRDPRVARHDRALHRYAKNDSVKAIIMRINSPGRSDRAVAGDLRRDPQRPRAQRQADHRLARQRRGLGRLLHRLACDRIVANPGSITGSIGVILQWMETKDLLAWAKLKPQTITSGAMKAAGSPYQDLTDAERAYFQGIVMQLHSQFVRAVAAGRKGKLTRGRSQQDRRRPRLHRRAGPRHQARRPARQSRGCRARGRQTRRNHRQARNHLSEEADTRDFRRADQR